MDFLKNPNFDFIRWRWHAIALSAVVILAGVAMIIKDGLPLGIDFSGGTLIVVKFEQPVAEDAVRRAIDSIQGEKIIQPFGDASRTRVADPAAADDRHGRDGQPRARRAGGDRKSQGGQPRHVRGALAGAGRAGHRPRPSAQGDLRHHRLRSSASRSTSGCRFRFAFAIGAIAATLHDVLVTVAFLTFFHYDLSLNIVAAILTITGYSVNDTIVIFDRVRENMRGMRRESLEHVVNTSVNQTLGRTIITAGTTFLAVLSLYLFGGEVLEGFAFTMLVGIISGTYSTVFIAAAIAIILSGKQAKARAATPARPPGGRKAS